MSQGSSIFKNTLIYAIGSFGSKAIAFLLLPLYTFYLTTDEFGIYDLFIVTINLLAPILTIQIADAVFRWLKENEGEDKKQSRIIFNGIAVISAVLSLFLVLFLVIILIVKIEYASYFIVLLMSNVFVVFFQKVLRGLNKNLVFAISGIINTITLLGLNILFLSSFDLKIESLFLASILANMIVLSYIFSHIKLKMIFRVKNIDVKIIKEMARYSLPLVPNSLSWWLINASDKYFILFFIGIQANGLYAISTRFAAILTLFNSIFLMAWQDHGVSVKENKNNNIFFSRLFNKFIRLELSTVLILISISPYLIKYLISSNYVEAWKYLSVLFLGTAFNAFSAYIGVGYQRHKKTKGILFTSLVGGVINVITSLSLISIIGLYAPALGTLVSFLVVYLLRKKETNKFFEIKVDNLKFIGLVVLALLFTALIHVEDTRINVLLIFISTILFVLFNRDLLNGLLNIVKIKILKDNL